MTSSPRRAVDPPFSPVLLAGMALAPVPVRLLQPACDALFGMVRRRHPDLLERLSDYPDAVIGIDPLDLPFVLILRPDPDMPSLELVRSLDDVETTARIRGPLALLVALGEGRLDGEQAFFTRRLVIEGETEVVLALRNAVDGAAIDLIGDLADTLGPLGSPIRRALGLGGGVLERLSEDMDLLRRSIAGPAQRSAEAQGARINALEEEVSALKRQLRRQQGRRE